MISIRRAAKIPGRSASGFALAMLLVGSALPRSAFAQASVPVHEAGTAKVACVSGCSAGGAIPSAGGAAPVSSITAASTYQTLFAAGALVNGCTVQNPSTNTASLYVDFAGATGTSLASTSLQLAPGASVSCAFHPTNAVTVFSTATISFNAVQF